MYIVKENRFHSFSLILFKKYNICTRVLLLNKIKYKSCAYELNQEGTSTSDLITLTRTSTYILFSNKSRVQMFYFDSNTARPIVLH